MTSIGNILPARTEKCAEMDGEETIQSKSHQLNTSFYPQWKHKFSWVVLTERERKDHFEHRAKNQTPVFQSGTFLLQKVETRKGIKLT